MKKIYWMGLLATLLLGGCSEEDGLNSGNGGNELLGEQAYLTVRIMDAGANTKATDGGFDYGSEAEHAVSDAQFYFYDEDGELVVKASAWNAGSAVTGEPVGNIEFNSNTIVVLRGLKGNELPKYMVTVLNAPATTTFDPETDGKSLAEMEKALSGGIYKNGTNGNFIMSTTSYKREDATKNSSVPLTYFVTELKKNNFQEEPTTTSDPNDVVNVYVERLAAKVTLQLASTLQPNTNGVYQLENVTIAGEDNDGGVTDGTTNNPPAEGSTEVYMKIEGWGLNATAKDSYMVKNINESWTKDATSLGFEWNDANNYRSYWGESYNYEDTSYPGSAAEVKEADKLTYISGNDIENSLGSSAYCAENTLKADLAKLAAARTSILLKAVLCDETGNPLDMVRYNGMLFKQDYYISYVLNALKSDLSSYYVKKDDTSYRSIDESDVTLVDFNSGDDENSDSNENSGGDESSSGDGSKNSDGKVKVQLKESVVVYTKSEDTFVEVTDIASIDAILANFNANNPAIGYNGGLMYYNIPIEHLRAIEGNDLKEGNYGVVRNHHYVVTINSLENVGKGIFNPDEVIVPGDDETVYYVGASIHILSWKIVNQEVDL